MLENLFVPLDLSETSDSVVGALPEMRKFGTKEVCIFHTIEYDPVALIEGGVDIDYFINRLTKRAEGKISQYALKLSEYFKVNYKILPTVDAVDAIVKNSIEHSAIMLVLSKSKSLLVSGIAERLARESKIPILIIKSDSQFKEDDYRLIFTNLFSKVGLLCDFSDREDERFREIAKILANFGTKEVCVIHVVDLDVALESKLSREEIMNPLLPIPRVVEILSEYWINIRNRLENTKKSLRSFGFTTSLAIRFGPLSKQIENVVRDEKISLVVTWNSELNEVLKANVPLMVLK